MVYILAFVGFLDFLGFTLVFSLKDFVISHYTISYFQFSSFISIFFVANFFGVLFFGPLSDKIGRRPIFMFNLLVVSILNLLVVLLQFIKTIDVFVIFFGLRVLLGFFSGTICLCFAATVDISKNSIELRRRNMAVMGIIMSFGFLLGPIIGNFFTSIVSAFLFMGLLNFTCFIIVVLYFKESLPKLSNNYKEISAVHIDNTKSVFSQIKHLLTNLNSIAPILLYVIYFFVFTGFEIYLLDITLKDGLGLSSYGVGIIWVSFSVSSSIFQLIFLKIFNLRQSLILGFLMYGIGLVSYSVTGTSIFLICISVLFCSIGMAFINPNIVTLISLDGSIHQQGLIFGITQSFGAIGRFTAPFFLGYISNYINNNTILIWIILGTVTIAESLVIMKIVRKI